MTKGAAFAIAMTAMLAVPAAAAELTMSDAQMRALLRTHKVLKLGGIPGDYVGAIVLNGAASGTARVAVYINGWKTFGGTWAIENGRFCRTYTAVIDPNVKVCETWKYISGDSVKVYKGTQLLGTNSW